MDDTIVCPHCKKTFPVTEAIKHQVEQEIRAKFEKEEKQKMWAKALTLAKERTREKINTEIKLLKEELEEEKKRREESQRQELEVRKERMKLEEEKKELELKTQRKLDEERKKIAEESYKRALEENRLRILENEKEKADLLKQIEELKQKASQGSQQTQGDVMEQELKNILIREFPYDEISDVPTGVRGADLVQVVKTESGKNCGIILWESKRTKAWSNGWISKLKEDQRHIKADLAVIVTQALPDKIKTFSQIDRIWVTSYQSALGLAMALRDSLIRLSSVRTSEAGKADKKEILWQYLNGKEFSLRLHAIADIFKQMQEEIEIEKRWFTKKWAKQEKNIRQMIDNIGGIEGDIDAVIGRRLSNIEETAKLESGE